MHKRIQQKSKKLEGLSPKWFRKSQLNYIIKMGHNISKFISPLFRNSIFSLYLCPQLSTVNCFRDRSQTLVRGAWCKKKNYRENFSAAPPPLRPQKISGPPPLLPWKLRVNPIEKHVNSIFTGKFVVIFFKAPLTRVKSIRGPIFASGPP